MRRCASWNGGKDTAGGRLDQACAALDRVLIEMNEANRALAEAQRSFVVRSGGSGKIRGAAVCACGRRRANTSARSMRWPQVRERFESELQTLTDGGATAGEAWKRRLAAAQKDL